MDQIEKLLSNLINENEIELDSNLTMEENVLAVRNENKKIKLLLEEIQKHYKLNDQKHKWLLEQCSLRLAWAANKLDRQRQTINDLNKKIHGSDTNDDVPDSTTEN